MLGKTSWYSIDVSENDRHILLFYKKCHFCHLLPFAKVRHHDILAWFLCHRVWQCILNCYSNKNTKCIALHLLLLYWFGIDTLLHSNTSFQMKKFYSVSDIPEEFIKKQITLRGKVKGHGKDHVLVEHLPILEGWKVSGKKPKGMPSIIGPAAFVNFHCYSIIL